jgi:hypothetical protein
MLLQLARHYSYDAPAPFGRRTSFDTSWFLVSPHRWLYAKWKCILQVFVTFSHICLKGNWILYVRMEWTHVTNSSICHVIHSKLFPQSDKFASMLIPCRTFKTIHPLSSSCLNSRMFSSFHSEIFRHFQSKLFRYFRNFQSILNFAELISVYKQTCPAY